jgi:hypothetical protein
VRSRKKIAVMLQTTSFQCSFWSPWPLFSIVKEHKWTVFSNTKSEVCTYVIEHWVKSSLMMNAIYQTMRIPTSPMSEQMILSYWPSYVRLYISMFCTDSHSLKP